MHTRRTMIIATAAAVIAPPLFARDTASPIPGGGSVRLPRPYKATAPGDHNHEIETLLTAYRNYRSTMAGSWECDGMIAVGRPERFESLADFVGTARGGLTTHWAFANESESRWYGKPEKFEEVESKGPNGAERRGRLVVHTVGWTVKDLPARLYAVNDRRGVMIAVWIYEKHGGEKRAVQMAQAIAASFTR